MTENEHMVWTIVATHLFVSHLLSWLENYNTLLSVNVKPPPHGVTRCQGCYVRGEAREKLAPKHERYVRGVKHGVII